MVSPVSGFSGMGFCSPSSANALVRSRRRTSRRAAAGCSFTAPVPAVVYAEPLALVPAPRTSDGNSLSHDHLCLYPCPFRDAARLIPEVVNSAQTSESSEIYKSGSPHKV